MAEKEDAGSSAPCDRAPVEMTAGAKAPGVVAKLLPICGILPTSRSRYAAIMATEGYAMFTETPDCARVDDQEVTMLPHLVSSAPAPQTERMPAIGGDAEREERLRAAARDLETAFLTEMLRAAGAGRPGEGLGSGGAGEDQFASFLVEAQAEAVMQRGGLGLAETLFQALLQREGRA